MTQKSVGPISNKPAPSLLTRFRLWLAKKMRQWANVVSPDNF